MAWEFEHAVECGVPREFAWNYWTNFANWDDPPAKFEFDGPFLVGTRLTTILPGQKLQSVIREVKEGHEATIEMELADAVLVFDWSFEKLTEERSRIRQRLSLRGEGAGALAGQAKVLEQSAPAGMSRISVAMERAWKTEKD